MRIPKMILFDYGQTLVNERVFDSAAGSGLLPLGLLQPISVFQSTLPMRGATAKMHKSFAHLWQEFTNNRKIRRIATGI